MQEYFVNFIVWYYLIKVKNFIKLEVIGRFIYLLNLTSALPMAQNLLSPMFQDHSITGRFVGFFIRFWWMTFGLLISIIVIVPFVVFAAILIVLPFVPFLQFANLLMQNLK